MALAFDQNAGRASANLKWPHHLRESGNRPKDIVVEPGVHDLWSLLHDRVQARSR
jgi:hypothetical protein